jgi:hypothetical protein
MYCVCEYQCLKWESKKLVRDLKKIVNSLKQKSVKKYNNIIYIVILAFNNIQAVNLALSDHADLDVIPAFHKKPHFHYQ